MLCNYIQDEKLHTHVPLPAHRVSEMSFVVKREQGKVDQRTWAQVISLYPHSVQATTTSAKPVAVSLHDEESMPEIICQQSKESDDIDSVPVVAGECCPQDLQQV